MNFRSVLKTFKYVVSKCSGGCQSVLGMWQGSFCRVKDVPKGFKRSGRVAGAFQGDPGVLRGVPGMF